MRGIYKHTERCATSIFIVMNILVISVRSFAPAPIYRELFFSRLGAHSTTSDYLQSLSLEVEQRCNDNNASEQMQPQHLSCEPMQWEGKQLSQNAYRVDLPPNLVPELRAYADRMGIRDMYNRLLGVGDVDGHALLPGTENIQSFEGYNWMVQRPRSHWASNMHWTSPADETAHDDYLRVLSAGGFDQVLETVGTCFELEALSAYHLSFIGVSHCAKGFIHTDVDNSGRKAFNMIIPLVLQDEEPELEILSDDETMTRFYRYKYNVASMMGDGALHATASCDYRGNVDRVDAKSSTRMRLAATVYIGDITPNNVNQLLLSLTQAYPPVGDAQHLLDRAGSHWSKSNSSKKLPLPIL